MNYELSIESQLDEILPGYSIHAEISSWLVNPDLKRKSTIGLSTLLAVWALGSVFPAMPNVSVLRASNMAASTLEQFGGKRLLHNGDDIIFHDTYYRGPVLWMAAHSRHHQERIAPLIADLASMLHVGLLTA
jgi:sterol desaturase/sphingolipid hydroxylase (fatty acid hydroxylase superfamily)